ncbi:hypothetical protein NJBCHELONAE_43410 [Mycobacteroides chelonae]|uniref:hypothetical protein n=1 Tax=Mycobacteroides chelonae TaxID=1774 RepID=UPI0021DDAA12|nr:hypothetical protein [Mycobacteroides chelonae]GLE59030.1 hypothetical protein NJBCHELONAE_43410 [Mycobacteroides chelonae]
MQPPTDPVEAEIVATLWPLDAEISAIRSVVDSYEPIHSARLARYDELKRNESTIQATMVSEDFDSMFGQLDSMVRNQRTFADNAGEVAKWNRMKLDECVAAQGVLVQTAEQHAPAIRELLNENLFQAAAVALALAKADAAGKIAEMVTTVTSWNTQSQAAIHVIDDPGQASGKPHGSAHDGNQVSPMDFKRPKQEGGSDGGSGKVGQSVDPKSDADAESKNEGKDKESHGRVSTDSKDQTPVSEKSVDSGSEHGHVGTSSRDVSPKTSGAAPQIPSSPLGGGSGGGTPSPSGLTSGLGGFKPPGGLEGMSSMTRPVPPSLPANPASGLGSGSGGGSGSGAPRFSAPPVPPPVAAAPAASALSQSVGASPAATAGGFGPGSAAMQPVSHTPAVAPTGGGMGAMGGGVVSSATPTAAQVGPAPTASPGLSQGPVNAGAASAAAGAGAGASGVNMMPAAFSDEGPKRMDQFAQMAANAVRVLAPAMAGIPGLLVAAAVVQLPAGIPQVVITTNEGAGYLPVGCYLPQSMTHAFFDVDTLEFDNKWFGWVDPARILVDYVAVRSEALGGEVQLLGLASSGAVSGDVKNLFPQVVPSVTADQGSKPLGSDNGRNAHRLKVLSPSWFTDVQMSTPDVRNRAAVRATEAAMRLAVAAPLREAGGPWQIMQSGRLLDDAEWAMFAERYHQEIKMTGAVRPGFMTSSQPGQMGAQYVDRFQLVRAMETLLAWRNAPDVSPEDIIYAAHEAGADVSHVLD